MKNTGISSLFEAMVDPYCKYAHTERDSRIAFPGYLPSDGSSFSSRHLLDGDKPWASKEYAKNDILPLRSGDYGLVTTGIGGLGAGASASAIGFTPLEDPALLRRDTTLGVKPGIVDYERPDPLRKSEGLPADESTILYVDGLPSDCTRREVGHLFRPFIGFKEIRVVHKDARQPGDNSYVLCFVEFSDAKCALTAMEALQGYKFDGKKQDSPVLRIQFAKFPFRPPNLDDGRHGNAH